MKSQTISKFLTGFFILAVIFMPLASAAEKKTAKAEEKKELPKGVIEIEDLGYPMYLYQPPAKTRKGEMIIAMTVNKEPIKVMEEWQKTAEKNGYHFLAAEVTLRDGELPTFVDKWVVNLKREMLLRYNIKRFYLLGLNERAHYVSYYGLAHPKEFVAYAAVGGSWAGPFEKIVKPTKKDKNQAPFFVGIHKESSDLAPGQDYSTVLTALGYSVKFVVLENVGEDSSASFQTELISWFNEQSTQREEVVATAKRPFKEKVSQAVNEFFAV